MERKRKMLGWLVDNADLPSESLPGQFILELLGRDRVLIENHKGVQEYGIERICVRTSFGSVSVCGSDLRLSCLSKERLVIVGPVSNITVSGRGQG